MEKIKKHFDNYLNKVYSGENLPEAQYKQIEQAFYGGTTIMLSLFKNCPDGDEEAEVYLDDIEKEIENFYLNKIKNSDKH